MKRIKMSFLAVGMMLAAGLVLVSCKKSLFENEQPETANMMAFNLVPDRQVTVALSGNVLGYAPLSFSNYTGGYLRVFPGTRVVESYDYASGDSLSFVEKELAVGKYYSTFVIGSGNSVQNVVVEDDVDSLSGSSGQAYVRYINAVNGSSSANVTISAGGSEVLNEQAAFAEVSTFAGVTPGDITVRVSESASIDASRTFAVEAGRVYTVLLLSGSHQGEPAQIRYISNGKLDDAVQSRGVNANLQ